MQNIKKIFLILITFSLLFTNISNVFWSLFDEKETSIPYCQDGECWLDKWIEQLKKLDDVETERKASVYIQDIVEYSLGFIYLIAVILIIYAWFHILTWIWDEEKAKQSKTMIVYVIIWLLIIFLAWPITKFILNILTQN
jgi:magnesium-transporting ATPase (P-type)